MEKLKIETKKYFDPPIHLQRHFNDVYYDPSEGPIRRTEQLAKEILCLPSHFGIQQEDINEISGVIRTCLGGK